MRRASNLIAGVACALSACRGITDVSTSLDVSLTVDRSVASSSAPVEITIRVVNRGTDSVQTLNPLAYGCFQVVWVYDDVGNRVAPPVRYCSLPAYAPVILAPGDSVVIRDRWSGDTADVNGRATAVRAGSYQIVGHVFAADREITSNSVVVAVN